MGKTQYYTATSIDGFIADAQSSLSWLFEVPVEPKQSPTPRRFFDDVGAMCMGATTYRWMVEHDRLLDHPEKWHGYYGTRPCWVFTHHDLPLVPDANLRFVQGDVTPVHDAMVEAAAGKNVWLMGGGELVGLFDDAGRLDEIILSMAPVFLGRGAQLLPRRMTSARVTLISAETNGQFAKLTYAVHAPTS